MFKMSKPLESTMLLFIMSHIKPCVEESVCLMESVGLERVVREYRSFRKRRQC